MIGEIIVCGILGGMFVTTTYVVVQFYRSSRRQKRLYEEWRRQGIGRGVLGTPEAPKDP